MEHRFKEGDIVLIRPDVTGEILNRDMSASICEAYRNGERRTFKIKEAFYDICRNVWCYRFWGLGGIWIADGALASVWDNPPVDTQALTALFAAMLN